jgi:hypothetical protein
MSMWYKALLPSPLPPPLFANPPHTCPRAKQFSQSVGVWYQVVVVVVSGVVVVTLISYETCWTCSPRAMHYAANDR